LFFTLGQYLSTPSRYSGNHETVPKAQQANELRATALRLVGPSTFSNL